MHLHSSSSPATDRYEGLDGSAAEISAHFAEVNGASVSKDTVSRITDRVLEDMQSWCSRPLQPAYAAVFIDAITRAT